MSKPLNRRRFLSTSVATAGAAGLVGAGEAAAPKSASDKKQANAQAGEEGPSSSNTMPCGTLGKLKLSRLILGSNMMGGSSHSRDLRYVAPLMRAYHTEEKIFETLALAEAEGINTLSQGDWELVEKYNKKHGGHMQQLRPLRIKEQNTKEEVRTSIRELVDQGAAAIYVFGHSGDLLTRAGRVDRIGEAVEWIREEGVPAGVGGHSLHVVIECEKQKVEPDFYFKTFHNDRYWSVTLEEYREEYCWYKGASNEPGHYNDNMWCIDPEQTIEVMKNVKAAWIAFKVLAAGAIHPKLGFAYALRNGADFLVVGMFDFQVQQDAQIARQTLASLDQRDRPWRA